MKIDLVGVSMVTGFPENHITVLQQVATTLNTVISFRSAGSAATGLIEENYGMKGFRIDTKSCDWGPMCGFVCADPRLTKERTAEKSYVHDNAEWTHEAMEGKINTKYFALNTTPIAQATGPLTRAQTNWRKLATLAKAAAGWNASFTPLAISATRVAWLISQKIITPQSGDANTGYSGYSVKYLGSTDSVSLRWRLVPITGPVDGWAPASVLATGKYYAICVAPADGKKWQRLPSGYSAPTYGGFEVLLGLVNPGSDPNRGFKNAITADYDLFSIGPERFKMGKYIDTRMSHKTPLFPQQQFRSGQLMRHGQVEQVNGWIQSSDYTNLDGSALKGQEDLRMGNVSIRIRFVAERINAALRTVYSGGVAVHHNDEAGNMALPKDGVRECLPVLALMPGGQPLALETVDDFIQFVEMCFKRGYKPNLKDAWFAGTKYKSVDDAEKQSLRLMKFMLKR